MIRKKGTTPPFQDFSLTAKSYKEDFVVKNITIFNDEINKVIWKHHCRKRIDLLYDKKIIIAHQNHTELAVKYN